MSKISTSKQLSPSKLTTELGVPFTSRGGALESTNIKEIEADVDMAVLQQRINDHVYDPDEGLDPQEISMRQLKQKAQDVFAGSDTFTANQLQRLVAALVLRELRNG